MAAIPTPAQPATIDGTSAAAPCLVVVAWHDPVVESAPDAIPTASDEALVWWTPLVGPTGVVMAHRFATYAATGPTTWTIEEVCATFGMGHANSRLDHTLTRLERFGIITRRGPVIAVRLMLAPLTRRQREALPAYLADALPA